MLYRIIALTYYKDNTLGVDLQIIEIVIGCGILLGTLDFLVLCTSILVALLQGVGDAR